MQEALPPIPKHHTFPYFSSLEEDDELSSAYQCEFPKSSRRFLFNKPFNFFSNPSVSFRLASIACSASSIPRIDSFLAIASSVRGAADQYDGIVAAADAGAEADATKRLMSSKKSSVEAAAADFGNAVAAV